MGPATSSFATILSLEEDTPVLAKIQAYMERYQFNMVFFQYFMRKE